MERTRQIEEKKRREQEAWNAMTPQQRADYMAAKQQKEAAQASMLMWGLETLMSSGSGGGGDGTCPDGSAPINGMCRSRSVYSPAPSASAPDTSVGCGWGDRAYGTCH